MSFLRRLTLCTVGLLAVSITTVSAADCPAIVKSALDATDNICSSIGRNQACYGNINLTAEPQADSPSFTFTKPGDLVSVDGIKTLTLSPLDQQADTWGVALMKLQANLPDTLPGQNLTFLLFGDVQIDNAVKSAVQAPSLEVSAKQGMNVRQKPSKTGSVLTSIKNGATLTATGRLEDSSWLRVKLADTGAIGWVSSALVSSTGDLQTLDVVAADTPVYNPMQAFYFKTGLNDAPCTEAPDSGILVQTPKGAGKVQITADGVQISLGSTVYLQAQASGFMTISVIEGSVTARVGTVQQAVPAGTFTQIPLDANLNATGAPQFPQAYDASKMQPLPITGLPDVITIATPLPATAIKNAVASAEGLPTPGNWRQTTSPGSACGANYKGSSIMGIIVEQDGAVVGMVYGSYVQRYYRTASGTYIPNDMPRDYRNQGSLNIRESEVLHVISATQMSMNVTDSFPASGCSASLVTSYQFVSG